MKLQKNGKLLCLVALLLDTTACRGTVPPKIPICIGDGFGGADCVEKDGSSGYRAPSELKNYWMTDQGSMSQFSAWCYRTSSREVRPHMEVIKSYVKNGKRYNFDNLMEDDPEENQVLEFNEFSVEEAE